MHRHFWFFLLAMACSPERLSAQISGRVVFLEKGGVERKATKDVLVYLEDVDVDAPAGTEATASTVTITSKNKKFEPRATAVIVGMGVEFPNLDDIMHNVFSISKGNRFDSASTNREPRRTSCSRKPGSCECTATSIRT